MSASGLNDPAAKGALRAGYRVGLGLHERLSTFTSGNGKIPKLYYGGARAGDGGGPLVKVKKLRGVFPEHIWTYNLIYLLSNAPYLPAASLQRLKRRGVPSVVNQNGVFYEAWYGGDWDAANRRMAVPYHLADYVFHQSDFCRRSAERFLGVREGPSEILYNAVDTDHFIPRTSQRPEAGPFLFLLAGKVQAHQAYRLEVTIEGLTAARREGLDARLLIAGIIDGSARVKAQSIAEKLSVADVITYGGPYSQEDAPKVFASADAYVMTNHNDACPSSVIEAMASGLPVIYAKSGGVPELVGVDAGIGIETGESFTEVLYPQSGDMADAMQSIAAGIDVYSTAARARAVDKFHIGQWFERHKQVFEALLDGRSA